MPKLHSYVVRYDMGFAPNPFFGYCTLATCKWQLRERAAIEDWIAGTGGADYGLQGRLVFAMQVSEILDFDAYWRDERFYRKRPVLNGSLKQLYGDNIYSRDGESWAQVSSRHSLAGCADATAMADDLKSTRVLIGQRFAYWGRNAIA